MEFPGVLYIDRPFTEREAHAIQYRWKVELIKMEMTEVAALAHDLLDSLTKIRYNLWGVQNDNKKRGR